jgi:DnaJ-class molecular chaperone
LSQALLGGDVDVDTVYGKKKLRIEEGTFSGK